MALEKFLIQGGIPLEGTVRVRGSKNAALPILCASLLTRGKSVIHNVPDLEDVASTIKLLRQLGVDVKQKGNGTVELEVVNEKPSKADYHLVRKMRASVCVLGPLLAKRGHATISRPGGCQIGIRPIDLHLKGIKALGANITNVAGYILAEALRLKGRRVYLGGPYGATVSGTANVMMAATLAEGITIIDHAACEPEVVDLAGYLNAAGAKVSGAGTPTIVVEGVAELHGAEYTVIPDRIESGTFMIAGAVTGGDVRVEGARPEHLSAVLDTLEAAGVELEVESDAIRVSSEGDFRPVDVTALPFPGFPTDLQSQITALLCVAKGISVVTDKVYPDRFIHVAELNRLGARIRKEGNLVVINGAGELSGAQVMASDLRASACLVLAALVASGTTEVNRIYHLDRGYVRMEESLGELGADIERVPADAKSELVERAAPQPMQESREPLMEI